MKVFSVKKEQILIVFYLIVIVIGLFKSYRDETVETFSMPLSKKVILIDAGHGGWDPGKVSNSKVEEKDINLQIAEKLQAHLEQGGAYVMLTRSEDEALGETKNQDMKKRKSITNEGSVDLFISIHQNSYPSENVSGSQVFYFKDSEKGKLLAECIQAEMKSFLDQNNNREATENSSYYVLKQTKVPAVLVECGFLSNPKETEMLVNDVYQEKMSWAIYKGILEYYKN